MAEVDFSHAKIEPMAVGVWSEYPNTKNPTEGNNVTLTGSMVIFRNGGVAYTISYTRTDLVNQQKKLVYQYQGTFPTSGSEFHLFNRISSDVYGWRIYNISFNSGDTFVFQIQADLICQ